MKASNLLECSFCLRPRDQVRHLIGTDESNACICERCVDICLHLVTDGATNSAPSTVPPQPASEP